MKYEKVQVAVTITLSVEVPFTGPDSTEKDAVRAMLRDAAKSAVSAAKDEAATMPGVIRVESKLR